MLTNYLELKISFRKQIKSLALHLVILVLVSGIIISTYLIGYIVNELSHDKFHKNWRNIYRITTRVTINGQENKYALSSPVYDSRLLDLPQIQFVTTFIPVNQGVYFQNGDDLIQEPSGFWVDDDFLNVFDFKLIYGSKGKILNHPNEIVITKSFAVKYFKRTEVLDHYLIWGKGSGQLELKIVGVLDDIPNNSHLKFDYLISGLTFPTWKSMLDESQGFSFFVYFKTNKICDTHLLQKQINALIGKYEPGKKFETPIQRIDEIYYSTNYQFDTGERGSYEVLIILITLLVLINVFLVINSNGILFFIEINKINLYNVLRTYLSFREIRKVIASNYIITLLFQTVYFLIIFGLAKWASIPGYIHFNFSLYWIQIIAILALSFVITSAVLTKSYLGSVKIIYLKKIVAVFLMIQIIISIVFTFFAISVNEQLNYLKHKSIGFNYRNVLVISNPTWLDNLKAIKGYFINSTGIASISSSLYDIYSEYNIAMVDYKEKSFKSSWNSVDSDFFETLGIEIIEGKSLKNIEVNDYVVINETLRNLISPDSKSSMIGEKISIMDSAYEIVGVCRDYHNLGYTKSIPPMVIFNHLYPNGYFYIKAIDLKKETLSDISKIWKTNIGSFTYHLLDDKVNQQIKDIQLSSNSISLFSLEFILILLTGIISLVYYQTFVRKKEFIIRRVYGATYSSLLNIHIKYLVFLSISAMIISIPIALYFINQWMNEFKYKTATNYFDLTFGFIILLILIIVSGTYFFYCLFDSDLSGLIKSNEQVRR